MIYDYGFCYSYHFWQRCVFLLLKDFRLSDSRIQKTRDESEYSCKLEVLTGSLHLGQFLVERQRVGWASWLTDRLIAFHGRSLGGNGFLSWACQRRSLVRWVIFHWNAFDNVLAYNVASMSHMALKVGTVNDIILLWHYSDLSSLIKQ